MPLITRTLKVLLIEDSHTDAIILERVFTKMADSKFEVKRVELLQKALDNLVTDRFDIILLDLSLPDSFGLQSLQRIHQITKTVPIIVLTGTDSDELAVAALREGAQDYLVKDISINSDFFARSLQRAINYAIERKQIVEQLRHSEALYRGAIEDQTEFICRFFPNGQISFVNQAFSRYLAETISNLLAENFFGLIAPEDLPLVIPSIESLNLENPNTLVEFRGQKNEPELVWQQWNIRAIFNEQEIVEYQAVGQDISDRKEAESEKARLIASLHESKEIFRVVTNSAPVLIWMTDSKGKLVFVNQFWLDFTGKTLEQALIEDWIINVHFEDRKECQIIYRNAQQNKESFALECRLLNHQNKYRWILNTGVPRFNSKGQFVGFVCSGIDISERKKAENLLAQQAKRNYILAEITKHIHEYLELETILQTTTEEINSFLQAEKVIIGKIISSDNCQIVSQSTTAQINNLSAINFTELIASQDWQIEANYTRLKAGEIITLNKNVTFQTNLIKEILPLEKTEINLYSVIILPIILEKKLWGILGVEQCLKPSNWQKEEIELLKQITRQLAIAIKQSELYHALEDTNKKLKELTVVDSLTGIFNRRKFDEYLASEWKRLAREKAPLSLILCDIDYFKLYNDTYGHQAGDRCLQKVAQAIKKIVKRPADLTARYGGEELAVILPNTTPDGAKKVAKDICRRIQSLQIPHINSPIDMYVTLSVGVTGCIPEYGASVRDLIAQADRNLYQAKEKGRNRVISDL